MNTSEEMQPYGKSRNAVASHLKHKGIRPTQQRVEMAHFLQQKAQHITAEHIYRHLNAEGFRVISQATIYNNLSLFVKKGIIKELAISSDYTYYDSNTTPHHHILDIESGAIEDIPSDSLSIDLPQDIQGYVESTFLLIRKRKPDRS